MINPEVDNQIFDSILTQALKDRNRAYLSMLPSEEELSKELHFSDRFNDKMNNIMQKYKRMTSKAKIYFFTKRFVAGILIVIGLGFSFLMLSQPVRGAIQNVVIQWFDKYTQFDFQSNSSEVEFMEFTLGYLPEGFAESDYFSATEFVSIEYKNLIGEDIIFEYSTSEGLSIGLDNENSTHSVINLHGSEAHLFESNEEGRRSYFLWIDNGYTFTIGSNLNPEEIIKIAENVTRLK